jgi:hypothetical protein
MNLSVLYCIEYKMELGFEFVYKHNNFAVTWHYKKEY